MVCSWNIILHGCYVSLKLTLTKNSLTLAGSVKSVFTGRTYGSVFNRIRQVAPTAQEWATTMLGCVPTALSFSVHFYLDIFVQSE